MFQNRNLARTKFDASPSQIYIRMAILKTSLLYFIVVFGVGFLLGPIRVLWLEPSFGKTQATLMEAPLLLAAMIFAARWVPRRMALSGGIGVHLLAGLVAVLILQLADFVVAIGFRNMTIGDQLASLSTPAGIAYLALVALFGLMPAIVNWRR
jgi:hypothetical protein